MSTLSYNSPGQVKRGVSFNLQRSLFTYASEDGVEVFHCSPFQASYSTLMSKETNIAVAAVYDDTNILALVGNPLLNKQRDGNTVYFFDGKQQEVVGAVQPGEMVLKVVIAHDRVFVATVHRLFVYKFEDLSLINDVPIEGSTGAFDISNHSKHAEATVIYAGSDHRVCLAGLDLDRDSVYNPPTGNPKDVITKVAITADGTKFAVARADGFNVEVYYLDKKDCGSYLRRGQAAKKINSISFNKSGEKLCCVSAGDKEGTIHVFEVPQNPLTKEPAGGLFSSMKSMVWGGGLPSVNSVGKFHYSREEYGDVIAEFSRDMEDTMYCLTSKGLYIRLLTSCDGKTIHKAVEAPFGESSRKDFDKLVTDTMREIEEASAEGGAWGG